MGFNKYLVPKTLAKPAERAAEIARTEVTRDTPIMLDLLEHPRW